MKLKEIYKDGNFVGLPLKVVDLKASDTFTFSSKFIIVTSIQDYSRNIFQLFFITHSRRANSVEISGDMEVELLKGLTLTKLRNQYDTYMLRNLHTNLNHACNIGADPEIFVENKNGEVIPAFEFLGSKAKPTTVSATGTSKETQAYWDGFQAEFTVDAGACLAYRCDSMRAGLKKIHDKAIAYASNARLSTKTVMDIPRNLLEGSADEHVEFGCMPSFNAYGMEGRSVPARELPFRSAGGHIHFGYTRLSEEETIRIVKSLDAILGVACVSLFEKYDNHRRRINYGLAGEYRTPKHGLEYRVLSNAWIFHPLITNLVFDVARKAMVIGQKNILDVIWKYDEKEVIRIINECDVVAARKMLKVNKDVFLKILKACYKFEDKHILNLYNIFYKGMDVAIKDTSNIAANWNLEGQWLNHCHNNQKNTVGSYKTLADGEKVG